MLQKRRRDVLLLILHARHTLQNFAACRHASRAGARIPALRSRFVSREGSERHLARVACLETEIVGSIPKFASVPIKALIEASEAALFTPPTASFSR